MNDSAANYTPGISERRSSASTFYHAGIKNAESQTNSSQSVTATKQFDAFGNLVFSTGTWNGPFGYAGPFGYQEDGDSSLKLLGHRYYDSSTARFLTRDASKDGRNWYAYSAANPVSFYDDGGFQRRGITPHIAINMGKAPKNKDWDTFWLIVEDVMQVPVPDEVKHLTSIIRIRPRGVRLPNKPKNQFEHLLKHIDKFQGIKDRGGNGNSVFGEIKASLKNLTGGSFQ